MGEGEGESGDERGVGKGAAVEVEVLEACCSEGEWISFRPPSPSVSTHLPTPEPREQKD